MFYLKKGIKMEKCARCRINGEVVQLYDGVYEGRASLLCERCAIIENVPIIKQPTQSQLKESERGIGVYERMKRMAGMKEEKKEEHFARGDRLKELDRNPRLETAHKDQIKLIDHFHWEIMKNRRRKGLTQEQLAKKVGVSTISIEMLEKANIPENAEEIIRRLENFFLIRLRKVSEIELLSKTEKRPVLLDENGHELEKIPEPKIESEELDEKIKDVDLNDEDFSVDKLDTNRVTIKDLRELHRRRIEVSKQEQKEEQRRIEERERLIEARKEELKLLKEKESKELDNMLGGSELLEKEEKTKDNYEDN